jgi:hypothetical protein
LISGLELNEQSLYTAFQGCFLPSFDSFGQAVSEKKIFLEINQSETTMGPLFGLVYLIQISPLTPPGQMNRNLVGSILGRSFTKTAHLHTIR